MKLKKLCQLFTPKSPVCQLSNESSDSEDITIKLKTYQELNDFLSKYNKESIRDVILKYFEIIGEKINLENQCLRFVTGKKYCKTIKIICKIESLNLLNTQSCKRYILGY